MKLVDSQSNVNNPSVQPGVKFARALRLMVMILLLFSIILLNLVFFPSSNLPGTGMRYIVTPFVLFLAILYLGARFTQNQYALRSISNGCRYLFASIFGVGYVQLLVSDGKAQLEPAKDNTLYSIGGPGNLSVQPGSAVLLEDYTGNQRVIQSGRHYVSRYESIKEIHILQERSAHIERLASVSKDGIEVNVIGIHYRYRLIPADRLSASETKYLSGNYPISNQALIDLVYKRSMTEDGVSSWHFHINRVIESVVDDYIHSHWVDHLTASKPDNKDPRSEIYELIYTKVGKHQLAEYGAELLWIDLGHFEITDKTVAAQRVSTWQASWAGNADIEQAIDETKCQTYQESGRAEAQAELLTGIVEAIKEAGQVTGTTENMNMHYLVRITQFLNNA